MKKAEKYVKRATFDKLKSEFLKFKKNLKIILRSMREKQKDQKPKKSAKTQEQ